MRENLQMADAVRQVIGGPLMKVTNAEGALHEVWCVWSDEKGPHREAFAAASLLRVQALPAGPINDGSPTQAP